VVALRLGESDPIIRAFSGLATTATCAVLTLSGYTTERVWRSLFYEEQRQREDERDRAAMRVELHDILAHQVPNKLYVITTSLDQITRTLTHLGTQQWEKYLRQIIGTLQEIGLLSKRALTAAEDGTLYQAQMKQLDLSKQLSEWLDEYRLTYGGVTVLEEIEQSISASGDEQFLKESVFNLLDNAREHRHADTAVEVTLRRSRDIAVLGVTNEGQKLPEKIESIFRAGFTTKKGHMGYGLRWVRRVAEKHGGKLVVERLEEVRQGAQGARLSVILPTSEATRHERDKLIRNIQTARIEGVLQRALQDKPLIAMGAALLERASRPCQAASWSGKLS
jgi:signal transduction histidine kinase